MNQYLKDKKIEKKVLKAFKNVSPSRVQIETKKNFNKYRNSQKNLFFNLKFPIEMFKNSEVVDFGCGTGELSIILSSFGAKVTGYDYNDLSIIRAKKIRDIIKIKPTVKFVKKNIYEINKKKNLIFLFHLG